MPAGSKIDPLLAKAKIIINSLWDNVFKKEMRDTQVSEEGGGGGALGIRSEIPLQLVVQAMVRQNVPLQPMEEPHTRAGGSPKEAVTPCEARAGASSWQELWIHGERSRFDDRTSDLMGNPCCSSLFLKDYTSWKRRTLEQFLKNCSPWEEFMMKKFVKECLPRDGPDAGAWKH
ncbi:hypothetical protein BTVI_14644 [Pitangus sulphuratus]|nr:hypothetical protein BTVI_14644 [Pitangus sulphuratus]